MNQQHTQPQPQLAPTGLTRGRSPLIAALMLTLALLAGVLLSRGLSSHSQGGASHSPRAASDIAGSPSSSPWAFDVPTAFALPAGTVSQTGGLTVLTTEAGNEDLLVVLDARSEELFVYRTDLKSGMQLLQRYTVSQLFADARARTIGGP